MATQQTATETITHKCGHTWIWGANVNDTRKERAMWLAGERSVLCPGCAPQKWHTSEKLTVRPHAAVTPVVAAAVVPVAPATPAPLAATSKQLSYLAILGVAIPADRVLTREEASAAIDEVKRHGGSIGWLGLEYHDGGM